MSSDPGSLTILTDLTVIFFAGGQSHTYLAMAPKKVQKRPATGVTEDELATFLASDFPLKCHTSGRWQFLTPQRQYLGMSTGKSLHEAASLDQFWELCFFNNYIFFIMFYGFYLCLVFIVFILFYLIYLIICVLLFIYLCCICCWCCCDICDCCVFFGFWHLITSWPNLSMFISILISYIPSGPMFFLFFSLAI